MKAKKILLVHMREGIANIASYNHILYKIINELKDEGRVIINQTPSRVIFEDGTSIDLISVGASSMGRRITHLYFEEGILNINGGEKYIMEALLPRVLASGNYQSLDVEGEVNERVLMFNEDKLKKYIE